jgi:hypothetical protein
MTIGIKSLHDEKPRLGCSRVNLAAYNASGNRDGVVRYPVADDGCGLFFFTDGLVNRRPITSP